MTNFSGPNSVTLTAKDFTRETSEREEELSLIALLSSPSLSVPNVFPPTSIIILAVTNMAFAAPNVSVATLGGKDRKEGEEIVKKERGRGEMMANNGRRRRSSGQIPARLPHYFGCH